MASEVLEVAARAPHTLLPCLGLLSELLPLTETEAAAALELRRLLLAPTSWGCR